MSIRPATPFDVAEIVTLRLRLFECFNRLDSELTEKTRAVTHQYFERSFDNDDCKTWVAETDQRLVALGSLALFIRPPNPHNLSGKEAYLMNMYTLPEYRRRGYSKGILQQAMAHALSNGFGRIWLHASDDGQPLYQGAGFRHSDKYMEWKPVAI